MNKKIDLTMINQGKVRDIYEIPNRDLLLIHTTDRISAFDVVLPNLIPQKGEVLNQVSLFWFDKTKAIIDNHIEEPQAYLQNTYAPLHSCETMVVKKLTPLPIEAVIRGYMAGSGWRDYEKTGEVCGVPLPGGLMKGSRLPTPIFTPATKAPIGEHDENITFEDAKLILTSSLAEYIREISIQLYDFISDYALRRGIILADTKFEFGTDNDGNVYLIDEVATPDSSRYWPLDSWKEGEEPECLDKEFIRSYLRGIGWTGQLPAPELPQHIVDSTTHMYEELQYRLVGPK